MNRIRSLTCSLIGAAALSVLLACEQGPHGQAGAARVVPSALVGLWQGFTYLDGQEIRVEVELGVDPEGGLVGVADFRDGGALDVQLGVALAGDSVNITGASGPLIRGRLSDDLGAIQGHLFASTMDAWYSLVLEKDNPEFRRFEFPRLTGNGEAQSEYSYRPPEESEDGWPVSTLAAETIDGGQIVGLVESVFREEQGRPEAILIARNGKLVLEEYFFGYSRDRMHSIQSATKSVTSLLLGIARDRGYVSELDQPVFTFYPEYRGRKWIEQKYPITLAHLLTMSAAIEWDNDASADAGGGKAGWERLTHDDNWIGYVLELDQAGEPGMVASYNSGLSILLGGVIRNSTGKYVDEFAEETLFGDLHVSSYRWQKARDGTRDTGGGLSLTAYDLAKMGQLVLDGGMWNGKRVVSGSWVSESVKRRLPLAEGSTGDSRYVTGFAYHWWNQSYDVDGKTIQAIVARGYGGQYLGIFPSLNAVVVLYNGEWGMPSERVFDYNVIVEEWILPAIG